MSNMRICKYVISAGSPGIHSIDIPHTHNVLSVGQDPYGDLAMWAEVKLDAPLTTRIIRFAVLLTGDETMGLGWRHIGTVMIAPLVFHVFQEGL